MLKAASCLHLPGPFPHTWALLLACQSHVTQLAPTDRSALPVFTSSTPTAWPYPGVRARKRTTSTSVSMKAHTLCSSVDAEGTRGLARVPRVPWGAAGALSPAPKAGGCAGVANAGAAVRVAGAMASAQEAGTGARANLKFNESRCAGEGGGGSGVEVIGMKSWYPRLFPPSLPPSLPQTQIAPLPPSPPPPSLPPPSLTTSPPTPHQEAKIGT